MPSHPFYILDVFAESRYAGNQLGVIRNAEDLSSADMQRIARETNFAETTFVLRDEAREGGFDVRIFTPRVELPFAGHPTIGTAWLIRREILGEPVEALTLNLKMGPIRVTFESSGDGDGDGETAWLHQTAPEFGRVFSSEEAAALLGIEVADIDARFPVQSVTMGIEFLFAPLKSMAALKRACFRPEGRNAFGPGGPPPGQFLFCPETHEPENDFCARMFAEALGVPEDPATGSANACFAGYLLKHGGYGAGKVAARVEQGYEIARPSLLRLRAESAGQEMKISVGGKVVQTVRGELV